MNQLTDWLYQQTEKANSRPAEKHQTLSWHAVTINSHDSFSKDFHAMRGRIAVSQYRGSISNWNNFLFIKRCITKLVNGKTPSWVCRWMGSGGRWDLQTERLQSRGVRGKWLVLSSWSNPCLKPSLSALMSQWCRIYNLKGFLPSQDRTFTESFPFYLHFAAIHQSFSVSL